MEYQDDIIEEISKDMAKRFGISGMMLKPSPVTIANMVKQVPAGRLISTDILRQELALQFEVAMTDPFGTTRALLDAAYDPELDMPYWRVVKNAGELIVNFPGGVERQAELLIAEGFTIETKTKVPRVKDYRDSLIRFHTEYQNKSPFAYK